MFLVAEIFDGFKIDQRVDSLGLRLVIRFVHDAAELAAPAGEGEGEADIECDRGEGDQRVPDIEKMPKRAGREQQLDDGGDDVERRQAQHVLDAQRAAQDDVGQAAGLPVQMKAHGQVVQMLKRLARDDARGAHLHGRENRVPQFGEAGGGDAHRRITDDEAGRHGDDGILRRKMVDRVVEQDRHEDRGDFRHDHADARQHQAQAEPKLVFRPQIGQQREDGGPGASGGFLAAVQRRGHMGVGRVGGAGHVIGHGMAPKDCKAIIACKGLP